MTETWFDQRPTHPIRPAALDAAHAAARSMWAERDEALDAMLEAQSLDHFKLSRMADEAAAADEEVLRQYNAWQADIARQLDMTRSEPTEHIRFMVMA